MGYQQKSYKKFVATAATATLVASAIVPVASAAGFKDVPADNEFAPFINALVDQGIINGYASDNTFRPSNKLTRGQVAIMLGRWLENNGEIVPADWNTVQRFNDVPVNATTASGKELAKYAALVKETGVFTGVLGSLNPGQNITRENMAVVLDRVASAVTGFSLVEVAEEIDDVTVADLDKAQAAYQDEIQALADLGITTVSNFRPKEQVSRAQFAKFLYTTFEVIEEVLAPATADELKAEVASIVGTLPAVNTIITVDNATAAKATAAEATTALAEVEKTVADGEYTEAEVTELNKVIADAKTSIAAVNKKADEVIEAAKAPAVESVQTINGKQLEVKFSVPVEKDSVIESNDTLVDGVFKFEKVAATSPAVNLDAAAASLSEDGRTLTITYSGVEYAAGDYVFSVAKNKVQTTNKNTIVYIPAYTSSTINVKDTVAPTLVSSVKMNATQYKLTFSKPVNGLGSISAKYADGNDLGAATVTHAAASTDADNNAIIVTLNNTTVNKDVNVQIVGITDYNGNIATPNPVTVTATAGSKDGVAPTFTVTPVSASTLTVKFSEEIQAFPKADFTIDAVALGTTDKVVQDKTDKTKYTITLATPLTAGFHNIAVAATKFKDLSGEDNAAHASTIQIKADQVAPVLSSSKVVKERDGKEYLYVTFDKDVQLDALAGALTGLTGKSVKNYVTDKTVTFNTAAFTPVDGSKREFKLDLASITTGSTPTALENGVTYTIDLPASAVKTLTGTPSVAQLGAITFTKGTDSATTALTVAEVKTNQAALTTGVAGKDVTLKNNQVTVEFSQDVDGASATKASNYVIDGAVVKSAELGTDKKTVTLTLEDNKTTYSGARYLTINNVTTASGVALEETFKKAITLNENIAPTVTAVAIKAVDTTAKVATVELTFSEAITTADVDTLAVYVDGLADAGVTVANVAATSSKTLTVNITLDNVSKLTNNTVTLKANGTENTIVDAAGNTADIGTVTVK